MKANVIASLVLLVVQSPATAQTSALTAERRFDCQLRLVSGTIVTDTTPVIIEFGLSGKSVQGIRVVDAGGILYPGGNMTFSRKPDGTSVLGGRPLPEERPGTWTGRASSRSYDLVLSSASMSQAVRIKLGTKVGRNGELPLLWQATGEPMIPGAPGISGSGTGSCRAAASRTPAL